MLSFFASATPEPYLFGLDQQTLISAGIQFLNACVLAFVLSRLLYKPVQKFMQDRADKIKAQLENAENAQQKANELKAQYEKKLKGIEQERAEILELARQTALKKNEQMLSSAQQEISAMKARAERTVNEDARLHIIDIASTMAEKFVSDSIDKDSHNKLFVETLAELEVAK